MKNTFLITDAYCLEMLNKPIVIKFYNVNQWSVAFEGTLLECAEKDGITITQYKYQGFKTPNTVLIKCISGNFEMKEAHSTSDVYRPILKFVKIQHLRLGYKCKIIYNGYTYNINN